MTATTVAELPTAELPALRQTSLGGASQLIIPTDTEPFVVAEHFRVGNPEVKIAHVDVGLIAAFGHLTEGPSAGQVVYSMIVERKMRDNHIFSRAELGEAGIRISFRSIYQCLLQQPQCQPGFLVTDGKANIGYAGDNIKAISLHASRSGWLIHINPIVYADAYRSRDDHWDKGCQVLSWSPFRQAAAPSR